MMFLMSKHWWNLALRGVVAVAFGFLTLIWPGLTVLALVLLFGIYVLMDGVATLGAVISREPETVGHRFYFTLLGVASIAAGILTFAWPAMTALALLYVIAAWALVTGIMEIAAAIRLRHEIHNEWFLALAGLLSVVFAVLLVITPGAGALVITWLIGWYAVVMGVVLIMLAFRLRGLHEHLGDASDSSVRPAAT
jgi:uncharacterized membrane protein HdeD (DUF308 family)